MTSVGDSYDNALMENFFSTLTTDPVYRNGVDSPSSSLLVHRRSWPAFAACIGAD